MLRTTESGLTKPKASEILSWSKNCSWKGHFAFHPTSTFVSHWNHWTNSTSIQDGREYAHHGNPGFQITPGNVLLSLVIWVYEVIMSYCDKHRYSTTMVGQAANKHQAVSNVICHMVWRTWPRHASPFQDGKLWKLLEWWVPSVMSHVTQHGKCDQDTSARSKMASCESHCRGRFTGEAV